MIAIHANKFHALYLALVASICSNTHAGNEIYYSKKKKKKIIKCRENLISY